MKTLEDWIMVPEIDAKQVKLFKRVANIFNNTGLYLKYRSYNLKPWTPVYDGKVIIGTATNLRFENNACLVDLYVDNATSFRLDIENGIKKYASAKFEADQEPYVSEFQTIESIHIQSEPNEILPIYKTFNVD